MNIDELKETWITFNERLLQNEIINQKILKEMIETRMNTSLDTLRKKSNPGFWICLIGSFIFLPMQYFFSAKEIHLQSFLACEFALLIGLMIVLRQRYLINKIVNGNIPVTEMQKTFEKYKKLFNLDKVFGTFLGFSAASIYIYFEWPARTPEGNLRAGIVISLTFLIGIVFTVINIRKYQQAMRSIKKDMEELKEYEK